MRHLELAHLIWADHLEPGMTAIDATAGRGFDALFIAQKILTPTLGDLHLIDIQEDAVKSSNQLLKKKLPSNLHNKISFHQQCHSSLPLPHSSADLIVYNLGYLPHADKTTTTLTPTTLESIELGFKILKPKSLMSITSYPGHPAGDAEHQALESYFSSINHKKFLVSKHQWIKSLNHPVLWLVYNRN